jgi:hypothetical protein
MKAQLNAQTRAVENEKRRLLHDKMLNECVATGQVPGQTDKISLSQLNLTLRKTSSSTAESVCSSSMDAKPDNGVHPLASQLSPQSLLLEREVLANLWQAQQQRHVDVKPFMVSCTICC